MMKANYRIQTGDGRIKYVGTGNDSWFTLDVARQKVNYDKNEKIVEHDGCRILWEIM